MIKAISLLCSFVWAVQISIIREPTPEQVSWPAIVFDLDNTLYTYPNGRSNFQQVASAYLQDTLKFTPIDASNLLKKYRQDYDAVIVKGLVNELKIDGKNFEVYVDGKLDLDGICPADERFKTLLMTAKARLYVLTNSGLVHAEMILKRIGLYDMFTGIIYVDYSVPNFPTKPDTVVYLEAQRFIGAQPGQIYFIDDNPVYAKGAIQLGWNAIRLNRDQALPVTKEEDKLISINSLIALPQVLPDYIITPVGPN